jgi:hypothetical protein
MALPSDKPVHPKQRSTRISPKAIAEPSSLTITEEEEESPYVKRTCTIQTLMMAISSLNTMEYYELLNHLIESYQFKELSQSEQESLSSKMISHISPRSN